MKERQTALEQLFDAQRVQRAISAGHRKLEPFRQMRNYAMREWVGAWYGRVPDLVGRSDNDKRPINILHQFIEAYLYPIVGEEIKFRVRPKRAGLRSQARLNELMINHRAREVGLLQTHRLVCLDALFSGLGIYLVGIGESADEVRFRGEAYDPGEFFVTRVDLDDYASDPNSRDRREDTWRAHRFRTTKDQLHAFFADRPDDDPVHDMIEGLPVEYPGGSENPGYSHEISGESSPYESRVYDEVVLWEVAINYGKKTFRGLLPNLSGGEWLLEPVEYLGYEGGPYITMSFVDVPNNTMPLSPAAILMDLHIAMARVGVKAVKQILRSRRAVFYRPVEEETVVRLSESVDDDDFIKCMDTNAIKSEELGGLSQALVAGFEWLKREANNATNNMQQARGVSGQANTATEAAYLQANMGRALSWMRSRAREALQQVLMHMAWDLDTNAYLNQTFLERMPGGVNIELVYDGMAREGNMTEFNWEVVPLDEPVQDRATRLNQILKVLQVLPAAAQTVAMLQGDVKTLVRIVSEEANLPELEEVFPGPEVAITNQILSNMAIPGTVVGTRSPTSGVVTPIANQQAQQGMAQPTEDRSHIRQVMSDRQDVEQMLLEPGSRLNGLTLGQT